MNDFGSIFRGQSDKKSIKNDLKSLLKISLFKRSFLIDFGSILGGPGPPKRGQKSLKFHPKSIKKSMFASKSYFDQFLSDFGAPGPSQTLPIALKRKEN